MRRAAILILLALAPLGCGSGHTAAPTTVRHGLVSGTGAHWFRWTAPASGRVTIAPAEAGPAPAVRVYRGTQRREVIASSEGGAAARSAPASFRAQAGRTYELEVKAPSKTSSYRLLLVASSGAALQAPKARQKADDGPAVSCGSAPSGWSAGTVSVSCTASSPVGLLDSSDAHFTLTASLPDGSESADASTNARTVCDTDGACTVAGPVDGIALDRRAPTTACDPAPSDWQAANVTIHCVAEDGGSGLAQPSQASMTFTTSVPAGQAARVTLPATTVCDLAGNCSTVGPFGPVPVDRSVPTATCAHAPAGWVGHQVSVGCRVSDAGAGLANPSQSTVTLSTNVGGGGVSDNASTGSVRVCSVVQTCVTVGPLNGLSVDLAPPAVTCTPPAGWSRGPVAVRCTAHDDGAGLAHRADALFSLSAKAPKDETGKRKVCDAVGNCAVAGPVAVKIDDSAPEVACGRPPSTWSQTSVTIRCNAYDTESGLAHAADSAIDLVAKAPADGSTADAKTGTRRVCSKLGVCATAGPVTGIRIDTTSPRISCSALPKGTVTLNVHIDCTASDSGSGLRSAEDGSFVLATAVAAGAHDAHAQTGSRRVCSAAGRCVTAGPFAVDVDRSSRAGGAGPSVAVPKRATVLLGNSTPLGGSAQAYPSPEARDSLDEQLPVTCSPGPTSAPPPGWTSVSCSATDGADRQTVASFPVVVKVDRALASQGSAAAGRPWGAAGVGYAPHSAVTVTFDGAEVATGTASAHGVAAVAFTVPAKAARGTHEVAVSGRDASGDPMTSLAAVQTAATVSGTPPHPAADAVPPPDPGPAPRTAQPTHFALKGTPAAKPSAGAARSWWWVLAALALLALAGAALAVRSRRRRPSASA